MQKLIEKVAVCEIFWAVNFRDYASASTQCYTEIQNITNYSLFTCSSYPDQWNKSWFALNLLSYFVL
jgi:hypothetical protein